jgi:DNA-binding NarL/FixJ family response regulator
MKFSKRELEVLKLQKEGVKSDEIIRQQLGMNSRKQVAVHRTTARRKVIAAKKFYQNAMKEYGLILFPGTHKKFKGMNNE